MSIARRVTRGLTLAVCGLLAWLPVACGGETRTGPAQPVADPDLGQARMLAEVNQVERALPTFRFSLDSPDKTLSWREMRSVLTTALASQNPSVFESRPPFGEANKPAGFTMTVNEDGSATFRWRYRNLGDYDQDSEVGLPDLSAFASYRLAGVVDSPDKEPVDGDLNSEINLQDITPLAQHWQSTVTGYMLQVADSPDAGGDSWAPAGEIPFEVGVLPDDHGWRTFAFKLEFPEDGKYYRVAPYYQSFFSTVEELNLGQPAQPLLYESSAAGHPQNVLATRGTLAGTVHLAWEPMPSALSYEVHRTNSLNGTYALLGRSAPQESGFLDTVVTQGVHYWYIVRAELPGGMSQFCNPVEGWPMEAPEPPEGLVASNGAYSDRIALHWQPSPGATSFRVNRRLAASGVYSVIGSSESGSFNDLLATAGVEYYYTVTAVNSAGVSAPSNAAKGLRSSGTAPQVLGVVPYTGTTGEYYEPQAYIRGGLPTAYSWNFGTGASPDVTVDPSPYVLLGAPGLYVASVTVVNPAGEATYEFVLDVRPLNEAPEIVDVYPLGGAADTVVSFSATTSGGLPTSYSWNFGGGAQPDITVAPEPLVTLGAPGDYNAALTAVNQHGQDVYYFTLHVGETSGAPATPAHLVASDGSAADRITLHWGPSAGAQGYKVYRDEPIYLLADVLGTTTFTDLTVPDFEAHSYWVRAYNDYGDSGLSAGDTGYRGLPAPGGVSASDGEFNGTVKIVWESVAGAIAYNVYRLDKSHLLGAVTAGDPLELPDPAPPPGVSLYLVYPVSSGGESGFCGSDTGFPGV